MTEIPARERRIHSTIFSISADRDLKFKLGVLRVVEKLPRDSKRAVRMNQVASDLWRRKLRCPVKPFRIEGDPSFLVPADKVKLGDDYSFIGPGNREYHLERTGEIITVDLAERDLDLREIVCEMVRWSFAERFMSLKDTFWRWHWNLFFSQKPENMAVRDRLVNAFRGIKFAVVWLDGSGIHLAADARTKYIGRHSLAEYLRSGNTEEIAEHLKAEKSRDNRFPYFLRDNVVVRYPCLYAGDSEETVESLAITDADGNSLSVLEYYKNKYQIALPAHDPVVYVKDDEHKDAIPVPASRIFPSFDTESIKYIHQRAKISSPPSAQLLPQKRYEMLIGFLHHVKRVRFGNVNLNLDLNPISERQQYFIPPNLQFGSGHVLRYGEISSTRNSSDHEKLITDWISSKMPALLKHGAFSKSALPRFYLWMPSKWDRSLRENVKHFLTDELKLQTRDKNLTFTPRTYDGISKLIEDLKQTRDQNAISIVGLSFNASDGTYYRIKQVPDTVTQCFTERTASRIHEASFRRNLSLAALIDAGVKPWVLDCDLNYDVYVGVDVLQNRAAFHFFWGRGASEMLFRPGHSVSQARRQEAIKSQHMKRILIDGLSHICTQTRKPIESLTIHRDGRWWLPEQDGLMEALEHFKGRGMIERNFRLAVAEIRKTHLPVRLFMKKGSKSGSVYVNPVPGVYRVINRDQMLLVCTWNPVRPDAENGRTSGVLLINIAHSAPHHDIVEVGEDVYALTQLNWTAPGIEINVPVTIRWADHRLREELTQRIEYEEDDLDLD